MNKRQYEDKIQALGCELLGSGLYSRVYAIPNTDKVIKVGDLDEWPSYIKWATDNGHAGKFAPKVYALKFHDDYYVAIMERLVCTINEMRNEGRRTDQVKAYHNLHNADCEALDLIGYVDELRANRLSGDLHGGNLMLRHDGQLVVTDPVSGGFSSERFRIKSGACL